MTRDTNFTSVFPSQSPLRLFSSHSSSSSVFYLHPSPHALASGAKFRRSKWKEFRQMHRWDKQLLTAWGLFFREGGGLEDNLCWWILTGLVEWGFMCPFHFHSACPCKSHLICCPANVPCGWHSGRSPVSAWLSPFPWDLLELSEAIVNLTPWRFTQFIQDM